MRILHTSDWHLGRKLHGESLSSVHQNFLDWFIDEVIPEQSPHLIVVSGDIYDRGIPPTEVIELFENSLERIEATGTPILITSGNHDSSVRLGSNTRWLDRVGLHFRTRISELTKPVILQGEDFDLYSYGIPYIEPDVDTGLGLNQLNTKNNHTSVLAESVRLIKASLPKSGNRPIRTLVASHAFVRGGIQSASERSLRLGGESKLDENGKLQVGGLGEADAELFAGIDYVAMGHLHGAQPIRETKSSTIQYSGSPIPFSFSEKDHEKQVLLVTITKDGVDRKNIVPIQVPQQRKMRVIEDTLENVLRNSETDPNREDWLHIILQEQSVPAGVYDDLKRRYPHLLKWEYKRGERTSIYAEISDGSRRITPSDITKHFYEKVRGVAPSEETKSLIDDCCETVQLGLAQVHK